MYPVPGDENHTWLAFDEVTSSLNAEQQEAYRAAFASLSQGVESGNNTMILDGLTRTKALQVQYGSAVIPSKSVTDAELFYNRSHIFSWMMIPLLGTFMVLLPVYLWNLFRNRNSRISFRNPFYTLGVAMYAFAIGGMILGYAIRWIASERIPISNGHESLLFISISVAVAGLIFELVYRMGAPGALGGLLTTIVLGVSMLSTFDPAIGPLVPVLVSYWLNIHVTIITSSYGFLGLSALIGMLTLFLLMAKGPGRDNLKEAIAELDSANKHILITGLGLLTVGTLLGGVWANESWGRYWGWDAKETWSLITILVYAVVLHFRWIPQMRSIWLNASGSLAAIASVVMTYFGVNYFLSGLHSYASGDAAQVPDWVFIGSGMALALIIVSGLVSRGKKWGAEA
jgi:cytochrome c-type biogenesis protein CcsB